MQRLVQSSLGMGWSQQEIERDLVRIRTLPGIQEAHMDGTSLVFTTKAWTLHHRISFLPLPRIVVATDALGWDGVRMKYSVPLTWITHWHPTLSTIYGRYRDICIGSYVSEVIEAYQQGPYVYVLVVLMMLQGIRSEDHIDCWVQWLLIGAMAVVSLPILAILATALHTLK